MTFPRHFDCTYVNTQKYEFRTISGRSTISGRRAIGAPGAPIVRNGRPRTISAPKVSAPKGREFFASFSWGFESVCFLSALGR